MVDQDSGAKIMYLDLYRGLNLKSENLTAYYSPLVSFDGKVVIHRGQIRLLMQAGSEVVKVDFIVVDAYSFYTIIVAMPWLHTLGVVSSTLHLKVKYPSKDRIEELMGSQSMVRNAYETHEVDLDFICHHLNVNPVVLLRKQPPRCLSKKHFDVVKEEVNKLKQVGAIKEVFYPEWLAYTIVVKKKNVKWRVYVDFTNLNKVCPNDAFQGHRQIPLALDD
nr:uncharacterized protein LOC112029754 [Quercus suber]